MSFPKRIIYLGFGVSGYRTRKKLKGPIHDPFLVYRAFRLAAASTFLEERSVVVLDPTGAQFIATVESAMEACVKDDLLVLYFSGHADTGMGSLELILMDDPALQGRCSIDRLLDTHRMAKRPKMLLLLDCCRSALAAESIFIKTSSKWPSNVELLAPTSAFELAADEDNGSPFALALSQALGTIVNQNKSVTMNGLVRSVELLTTATTTLHHLRVDGALDLSIAHAQIQSVEFKLLVESAYFRITTSRQSERETLWFSLGDEPEKLTLQIFNLLNSNRYFEPSWLVRRAMASALGGVKYLKTDARLVAEKLLGSSRWMDVAIGLNAAKRIFEKSIVVEYCLRIMQSQMPMDVKWLAVLYLNDVDPGHPISWDMAVMGGFVRTGWGLHEVTKELSLDALKDFSMRSGLLEGSESESSRYLRVMTDLNVELEENAFFDVLKMYSGEKKLALLKAAWAFYSCNHRGMNSTSGARKWLRSKLYGSWRRAINVDFASDILASLNAANRYEFLRAIPRLVPSVPHRMAVFEGGTPDPADLECLSWGALDPHPWVRRAYLEYLCRHDFDELHKRVADFDWRVILEVDSDLYPGQIDLFFQVAATLRYEPESSFALKTLKEYINKLSADEKKCLGMALKNEGIFL